MAEPELDTDKLDDAALAILSLTLHDGDRVWKGMDWSITDRLYAKGLIHDPVGNPRVSAPSMNPGTEHRLRLVNAPWLQKTAVWRRSCQRAYFRLLLSAM